MSCAHPHTTIRRKYDHYGRKLFARQCDACNAQASDWIPHDSPIVAGAVEGWVEEPVRDPRQQPLFGAK